MGYSLSGVGGSLFGEGITYLDLVLRVAGCSRRTYSNEVPGCYVQDLPCKPLWIARILEWVAQQSMVSGWSVLLLGSRPERAY